MRVKVLKELPQGQEPGAILDLPEKVAEALITVGAVECYEPSGEILTQKAIDDDEPESDHDLADKSLTSTASPARRRYLRRDLKAQP
jgi:hypothetical protein